MAFNPNFIKFNLQKFFNLARLGFVRDATDKFQIILTTICSVIFLGTLTTLHFLNPSFYYSVVLLVLLTPLVYLFVGKLLARIKQTLASQRRFVSNVVHELNGSMTVMKLDSEAALVTAGFDYRLGLSKIKSQELVDALKTDLSGLSNMANIIKNLSILASYEHKVGQIQLAKVNIGLLLDRLCKAVSKQLADKKDIDIDIDIDNKLPAYVLGNETALEQMIINLLSNAIKYSPVGGRITASIANTPDEVIMSVKDRGIGIVEEDMLRMFEPFYRSGDRMARKEEGSGLGLAIVSEVVKEQISSPTQFSL